jgi:tetratricopeptide (TPR) repeat protein
MDAYENAFKYLDKAIELAPNSHALHSNKAAYLFETNHVKEAIQSYKAAIKLCPENPGYYVEIFYCLASIGEYEKAWQFYEYRYQSIPQVALVVQHSKLPVLHERKDNYSENIAIVLEQGLGDTIMYLRFLEEFQVKAPNSYLVCDDQKIIELLQNKNIRVKDKIESSSTHIIGLLSLPYHLNIKEIPKPFDLGKHSPTPADKKRVGIVWAGSAYHPMDSIRSTYLSSFQSFYDDSSITTCHFMTDLRKRKRAKSAEVIDYAEGLSDLSIVNYGSKCKSVANTVKELNNIDVLVTVDTAIAHIAGSIGVPTYLLVSHVSDWRWGRFGDKSDWYNSIQIIRNTKNGSYADLITQIHKKIGEC